LKLEFETLWSHGQQKQSLFEAAVNALGPDAAKPKSVLQLMNAEGNVEGLTTENIKSHLQKHRKASLPHSESGRKMLESSLRERPGSVAKIGIRQKREFRSSGGRKTTAPASGFHGVSAKGKRWIAQIYYDSKSHHLGTFDTKQEAALAYDREARERKRETLNYESISAAEKAAQQACRVFAANIDAERRTGVFAANNGPGRWTRTHSTSGFIGVTGIDDRWQAQIRYGGKQHYLGQFG
jgi:SHAQKYF class myb-like DNA-binding protein